MNGRKFARIPYDLIGSRETGAVAVVEVPENLSPSEVAKDLMKRHPHVKSVLQKVGAREGDFRIRPLTLIAGSEDTEVVHKEYGYKLKLDPKYVYFSPREATERQLIANQVKDGEFVLVMFAGVGPYAIAIAKAKDVEIVGIELNPIATRYFQENVLLNKIGHKVFPIEGDVAFVTPALYGLFDRVVMPLPKGAYLFIPHAIRALKKEGGIIHFYYWGDQDAFRRAERMFQAEAMKMGLAATSIGFRRVSSYSPRIYKIRVDFLIKPADLK